MEEQQILSMIHQMAEGENFTTLIDTLNLPATEAMRGLGSKPGFKERLARRRLARANLQLLSQRWACTALMRLCQMLKENLKDEVRLRVATAILDTAELVGGVTRTRTKPRDKARTPPMPFPPEVIDALTKLLIDQRQKEISGETTAEPPQISSGDQVPGV